ncbi:hypothetical protein PRUPE_4G270600 [Prunus persica]|uniref:Uncharacterized protein n=1 Tax=Prunus persica TaxID=3760 RepID=M5WMG6_PRUPE|nr:hypothetical protein PRUPE_4G270600 [Prunus persica]
MNNLSTEDTFTQLSSLATSPHQPFSKLILFLSNTTQRTTNSIHYNSTKLFPFFPLVCNAFSMTRGMHEMHPQKISFPTSRGKAVKKLINGEKKFIGILNLSLCIITPVEIRQTLDTL